jgi:hypothetical protein
LQRWQCKQHCIAAALPHEKRIWHRVTVVSPSLLWCWQHKNPAVFGPALGTMTPTMTATVTGYGGGSSPHKQQNKNNNHNSGRNRTVTATRHCCDKASAVAVAAQQQQLIRHGERLMTAQVEDDKRICRRNATINNFSKSKAKVTALAMAAEGWGMGKQRRWQQQPRQWAINDWRWVTTKVMGRGHVSAPRLWQVAVWQRNLRQCFRLKDVNACTSR